MRQPALAMHTYALRYVFHDELVPLIAWFAPTVWVIAASWNNQFSTRMSLHVILLQKASSSLNGADHRKTAAELPQCSCDSWQLLLRHRYAPRNALMIDTNLLQPKQSYYSVQLMRPVGSALSPGKDQREE